MAIHPTAVVDPSARIGSDVEIGPFTVIGPSVTIGDGCRILGQSTIAHTDLGPKCVVYPQAALGLDPQHLQYKGEPTTLIVGEGTVFREGVTAHRGTALDKSVTRIGSGCLFMALSHIAHDCVVGNRVILANAAQLAGHVEVGDGCFISATAGIHQHVRIGAGALVSGGAMVPLDVAPYCLAQGDRAFLRGLNVIGMRRGSFSRESIRKVKSAYKTVFLSGLALSEALAHANLHDSDPAVETFRSFLSMPKRGFIRPDLSGDKAPKDESE